MLRVQSFNFNESDKINQLLDKYRLAPGAHILVSNGELVIPYEDGEPINKAQRIIAIKEQKNTIIAQMDIVNHSQQVLGFLINDAQERVAEAERKIEGMKGNSSDKDTAKEKAKEARKALSQLEFQRDQNKYELTRLQLNIELFDEAVQDIENDV